MTLSVDEQELYDVAVDALPDWYASRENPNEQLGAKAKALGPARAVCADLLQVKTRIGGAAGETATEPDWLNQHARDRGTSRRLDESDSALRTRLRNIPDMLTRPALLAATQALLEDAGITGEAVMVEIPRDGIFAGDFTSETGTGGTFTVTGGGAMLFEPTAGWQWSPYQAAYPWRRTELVFSGADFGANDGTHEVTGVVGDAARYVDAGTPGLDAGVSWTLRKIDVDGNVRDGRARAYAGRGYRANSRRGGFIIILPYPTTAATQRSVEAMLRVSKGAGVFAKVERRLIP